jgi:hypothetical protein
MMTVMGAGVDSDDDDDDDCDGCRVTVMRRSQNEDGSLWCIVIFTPIVKKHVARQQGIINIAHVMLASQSARKMVTWKQPIRNNITFHIANSHITINFPPSVPSSRRVGAAKARELL